jgi:hypothetical protein
MGLLQLRAGEILADFGLDFLPMLDIPSMLGRPFLRLIRDAAGLCPFTCLMVVSLVILADRLPG